MNLRHAQRLDRWHRRTKRLLLGPVDFYRPWWRELQAYYRHLSVPEFWMRFWWERMRAKRLEQFGPAAYAKTDYWILRQMQMHRNSCWHAVEQTVPPGGFVLEFGCGVAPIAAWLTAREHCKVHIHDLLNARTSHFARWRFRDNRMVAWRDDVATHGSYDAITAMEVLEHLPDPLLTVKRLWDQLVPGGYFHLNLTVDSPAGLDLATEDQAQQVRGFLVAEGEPVISLQENPMHAVYRKP